MTIVVVLSGQSILLKRSQKIEARLGIKNHIKVCSFGFVFYDDARLLTSSKDEITKTIKIAFRFSV